MTPVGRILIIPRDEYAEDTLYKPLDLVTHNGAAWLCKKTAQNIEPSAENGQYWMNLFNFAIINNLAYTGENGALDARQGAELKKMIEEKAVYELLELSSDAEGKVAIPIKDGYSVYSVLSHTDGYTITGNAANFHLHIVESGNIGSVVASRFCKVAVTYVKKA